MREHFHDTRPRAARAVVNTFRVPIEFALALGFRPWLARGRGLVGPAHANHFIAIPGKNR